MTLALVMTLVLGDSGMEFSNWSSIAEALPWASQHSTAVYLGAPSSSGSLPARKSWGRKKKKKKDMLLCQLRESTLGLPLLGSSLPSELILLWTYAPGTSYQLIQEQAEQPAPASHCGWCEKKGTQRRESLGIRQAPDMAHIYLQGTGLVKFHVPIWPSYNVQLVKH